MVENVAPLVAEAYEKDHRGLDSAYDTLSKSYSEHDLLQTARATAAFPFSSIHLDKEDTHLYRIFKERVSLPEQAKGNWYHVPRGSTGTVPRIGDLVVPADRTRRS
jgi:hypothetical protein